MAGRSHNNKKKRDTGRSPVSELSDDLLLEIISRVPFKSLCRCKCVSTRWRGLVSHPDHRKKLPQSTLAGFFYQNYGADRFPSTRPGYQSLSGSWCPRVDTSLSFLPRCCEALNLFLLDCCNGLLLCRHRGQIKSSTVYVVCNPATEEQVAVPAPSWSSTSREVRFARLAFDPDISSHFHVFQFATTCSVDANTQDSGRHIEAIRIYSSKTRSWTHPIVWDSPISLSSFNGVFSKGLLYLSSFHDFVVAVGMEGSYRVIRTPLSAHGNHNLYLSRGQVYLAHKGDFELSIWALEDSDRGNWTLMHNVSHSQLLGGKYSMFSDYYMVISMHPESNVIFILCGKGSLPSPMVLMSYEMDSTKLSFIRYVRSSCRPPFVSYVPFFSESLPHATRSLHYTVD